MSWDTNCPHIAARDVKCSWGLFLVHINFEDTVNASGSFVLPDLAMFLGVRTPSSYCGSCNLRYAAPVTPHIGCFTLLHSPFGFRYFCGKQKEASTSGHISDNIVSFIGTTSTLDVTSPLLIEYLIIDVTFYVFDCIYVFNIFNTPNLHLFNK